MSLTLHNEVEALSVGVLEIDGLSVWEPTAAMEAWMQEQCQRAKESTASEAWDARREAVRGLLRKGGYKPSGRNKPAQEYLLRCLSEGNFPRIHPAVDCLNAISVRIGLPISMLTRDRFPDSIRLRLGRPGEKYVFNSVGHELELEDLIVVCGGVEGNEPLGSPVKDSMAGKITETVRSIVCILYAPAAVVSESQLAEWTAELKRSIQRFATP